MTTPRTIGENLQFIVQNIKCLNYSVQKKKKYGLSTRMKKYA